MRILILVTAIAALSGCNPVRAVGNVAIGAGQVALGAADVII